MTINAVDNRNRPGASTAEEIARQANSPEALRDEFLTLMVAQIRNQDPLNPLDGTEYVSQLAQLSSMEGIQNLSQLQRQGNVLMDSLQVLQSTQLAGQQVSTPVTHIQLDERERLSGVVELPAAASDVRVWALGSDGRIAAEVSLGALSAGSSPFELPQLPPGSYKLEVVAQQGGDLATYTPVLSRTVEKVSVPANGGDIQLQLAGIGPVSLYSVRDFLGGQP